MAAWRPHWSRFHAQAKRKSKWPISYEGPAHRIAQQSGGDRRGRANHRGQLEVLVNEALRGKHRLPAVEAIFDRLEGRSTQRLDANGVTADLRSRSDAELKFYLRHDRWPAKGELPPS